MAFTPKEKEISKIIKETTIPKTQPVFTPEATNFERKKQYQFTLKPSNREKLDRLAKTAGARSASDYLDRLLESMEST
ncbi:hypothetical protein [Streptococcus mutans]|uniref:hypothetical protein n=1 Tax=Streptococcus mutans TaxID=1309 RepID=UPI0028E483FF|nr:hypothetical protein [Streptococcus mutans]MDT9554871.1 hypothetical protein [Streptococcus mutans]MDT9574518.1 hypothetical protein [Streptococcus mutans]MDT9578075.1 hypothetical protein [Streptococcus mutans]